jgi:hypothetical protein
LKACLTFGWIWYCKNHFLALVVGRHFKIASVDAVSSAFLVSSASVEASAVASSTAVGVESSHGSGMVAYCYVCGLFWICFCASLASMLMLLPLYLAFAFAFTPAISL